MRRGENGWLNVSVFLPKQTDLDPSITPVNSFRLIFSQLEGKPFHPLKDRSYWAHLDGDNPYQFSRVLVHLE